MTKAEKFKNLIPYPAVTDADVELILDQENVWASQKAMAQVFDTDQSGIARHLASVFTSGELDEGSNMQKVHSANSSKPVQFYSLDAVISVGYRVNSKKATQFRIWANSVLKQYMRDGFVINEDLLRSDPSKLSALAAQIRGLRANEKSVYASVRECFKIAASDYEPSSKEVKSFYALLQDKFHHAITGMTASKLVMDRANHSAENMGLKTIKGVIPTKAEVKNGKNYLGKMEVYRMHLLSEQFLLYAESTALQNKKMTMAGLHAQLDRTLEMNDYPVFGGYTDYIKDDAMRHAEQEYAAFLELKKLEYLGVEVDLETFYEGGYKDYKEQTSKITNHQLKKTLVVQS